MVKNARMPLAAGIVPRWCRRLITAVARANLMPGYRKYPAGDRQKNGPAGPTEFRRLLGKAWRHAARLPLLPPITLSSTGGSQNIRE